MGCLHSFCFLKLLLLYFEIEIGSYRNLQVAAEKLKVVLYMGEQGRESSY